jgi:hypothetical protein
MNRAAKLRWVMIVMAFAATAITYMERGVLSVVAPVHFMVDCRFSPESARELKAASRKLGARRNETPAVSDQIIGGQLDHM